MEVRISVDVDVDKVLDETRIEEVIDHYGASALLEEIGIEEAKDYFDLIEDEGE